MADEPLPTVADLPALAVVDDVAHALGRHWAAVLTAPPGAGKTTGVPPALLAAPWCDGRIVLTQPRRLAARVVARRLAERLGTRVGEGVGLVTGDEQRTSRRARIEVCTEGVLVQRLLRDPGLDGTSLVVLDELHERSLQVDLALALTAEVATVLRDDLRVLVMSATLDGIAVEGVLDDAPRVHADGRMHPVTDHWRPRPATVPLARAVVDAVGAALDDGPDAGDVLVFLPGRADVRRAAARLRARHPDVAVHELHGGIPSAAQDAALRRDPAGRRRVVLATAIAETSLTVEGVTTVVDSGLRRAARHDPATGLTRLDTVPASAAEVTQRRGRAGRVRPGHCHHLYSPEDLARRARQPPPAMRTADLSELVLTAAEWGAAPGDLRLLTPPPPRRLATARRVLHGLALLAGPEPDDEVLQDPAHRDRLTARGRGVARLPVHPRLAAMLLAAPPPARELACRLAALLHEGDVLRDVDDPDVVLRLEALAGRGAARTRLDGGRARRVARTEARLARQLRAVDRGAGDPDGQVAVDADDVTGLVARLAAVAHPDRVGEVHGDHVLLAGGRRATLAGATAFAGVRWLVALAVADAGREARIHLAAAATADDLVAALPARLAWRDVVAWDAHAGDVVAERRRQVGSVVVARSPLADPAPDQLADALLAAVRDRGLDLLALEQVADVRARSEFLREHAPQLLPAGPGGTPWPDLSDAGLLDDLAAWLGPFLGGLRRVRDLGRVDLAAAVRARFSHAQWTALDRLAPTHLQAPSGARHRLRWPPPGAAGGPVLAARLQEFLGAPVSPTVAGGTVPVVLHLLSPAGRPLQVTADLAGFWDDAWPAVRAEMRGRYPKHHWPEDPRAARPTTRTTTRGAR